MYTFPQDGKTAADIACENKKTDVYQDLLNSGAPHGSMVEPKVLA